MEKPYVLIVPHNDDELIFCNSVLPQTDTVITLVHYDEEQRALEQRMVAKVYGFKQMHMGLHDSWMDGPSEDALESMLTFVFSRYPGKTLVVPDPVTWGYAMYVHRMLCAWAEKHGFVRDVADPLDGWVDVFRQSYCSQEFLRTGTPEWFEPTAKNYLLKKTLD